EPVRPHGRPRAIVRLGLAILLGVVEHIGYLHERRRPLSILGTKGFLVDGERLPIVRLALAGSSRLLEQPAEAAQGRCDEEMLLPLLADRERPAIPGLGLGELPPLP